MAVTRIGVTPGVVSSEPDVIPTNEVVGETHYVVEVIQEPTTARSIARGESSVSIVEQGGTLVNVGAGPVLPPNPYEGQVWILT